MTSSFLSKPKGLGPCIFLFILFGIGCCFGTTKVYPGPGGDQYRSKLYRVFVNVNDQWLDSYVYQVARRSVVNWKPKTSPSVNFTTFGTNAEVSVLIEKLGGSIQSIEISPKSKSITAQLQNGKAVVILTPYQKAWVTINHDEANPLFIYADPPMPQVPPGALYFGPGIHYIGLAATIKDGQTVYLDGGSWVIGTLDLRSHHNVTITGPGVLSGENWPPDIVSKIKDKTLYHMIIGDANPKSHDNRLENITIINSPSYSMQFGPDYIGNVKLISPWFYSTDGFQMIPRGQGRLALIEHCFAFVGDDVFFPRENYRGSMEIRDCFVSSTNNSVFQICYWGGPMDHNYTVYAHDIDIKNYLPSHNSALFRASIDGASDTGVKNMTFENIHIEGTLECPLIQIENRDYFWPEQTTKPETKLGNSFHFIFRNITVEGMCKVKSTLLGLDPQNGLHDYLFENLNIGGVDVTEKNFSTFFEINKFASDIRFINNK